MLWHSCCFGFKAVFVVIEPCLECVFFSPTYIPSLLSRLFTVGWYIIFDDVHCPFSAHMPFKLQLPSFVMFSVLFSLLIIVSLYF